MQEPLLAFSIGLRPRGPAASCYRPLPRDLKFQAIYKLLLMKESLLAGQDSHNL